MSASLPMSDSPVASASRAVSREVSKSSQVGHCALIEGANVDAKAGCMKSGTSEAPRTLSANMQKERVSRKRLFRRVLTQVTEQALRYFGRFVANEVGMMPDVAGDDVRLRHRFQTFAR